MIVQKIKNGFFTLFILGSFASNAQWNVIYSATVSPSSWPFQLDYTSDSAIVVTSKKDIFISKNNGTTFNSTYNIITTPTVSTYNSREFGDVSFSDKDTGSIGGFTSIGFYTTPFCQSSTGNLSTWQLSNPIISTAPYSKINTVNHLKNKVVYAFDSYTNIYKSVDGGLTWLLKNQITTVSPNGFSMCMINEQTGYFVTTQGVFKTIDGGQTISGISTLPSSYANGIRKMNFRDVNNGYIIASNGLSEYKLFKTTDGGISWQDVFGGKLPDPIIDVNFPTNDTGFVLSNNYILQTYNNGNTWFINRFTNKTFYELDFINKNQGVVVASVGSNTLEVLNGNATISNYPFALFSAQTNYCCNGYACNFINYGSPLWSYKWYVNNILASSSFTPTGLILPNSGNNTIKLVTSNGSYKDSVINIIYNANAFSGNSGFNLYSTFDSTICFGTPANIALGNVSNQLEFAAFSNSVQITTWNTSSNTTLYMSTNPMSLTDSIITITGRTYYYNCPGNSFSINKHIKVLSLPPSNLLSLPTDSICLNDTIYFHFSPCTSKTTYTLFENGYGIKTFTASTGTSYNYQKITSNHSANYNYASTDSNSCVINNTPLKHVKVDSLWIKLETKVPAVIIGDTIMIKNNSVATNYSWSFTPGTNVISNNDTILKLSYVLNGDYYISLKNKNKTGCRDSVSYKIGVYNTLNQGNGTLCFSDTTSLPAGITNIDPFSFYINAIKYQKFHVDINENYYVAKNVSYSAVNQYDPYYGEWGFLILKYDKNGILKWKVSPNFTSIVLGPFGGSNHYLTSNISTISSDPLGNVYITGNVQGDILKIGNKTLLFPNSGNFNIENGFIAMLDSLGNCKWMLAMSPSTSVGLYSNPGSAGQLVYHNQNTIYFKADYVATAVFTNTTLTYPLAQSFLAIIDTGGNLKHINYLAEDAGLRGVQYMFNNSSPNIITYHRKMLKHKDKLIFCEYTNSNNILLPNSQSLSAVTPPGYNFSLMAYVIVTDTLGNFLNAFKPAYLIDTLTPINNTWNVSPEYYPNFSVDKQGFLYFSWNVGERNNYNINSNTYNKYVYTAKLNNNATIRKNDPFSILAKYDLNGNLIWHNEANYLFATSVKVNNDGNVYGLGWYNSLSGFESTNGNNQLVTNADSCQKAILFSYDANGNFLWGKPFSSSIAGNQYPIEIGIKDTCNSSIYFSVGLDTTAAFMGQLLIGNNHMHIFKVSPNSSCSAVNCFVPTNTVTNSAIAESKLELELLKVFPNPSNGVVSIENLQSNSYSVDVYNAMGQLILHKEILNTDKHVSLYFAEKGLYVIVAKNKLKNQTEKVIITD